MREDQVEAAVRESLERHAREADVDVPVAERARAAADRGPGAGRLLLVAAAVVAVVAGGVAIAQTRGGDGDSPTGPKEPPTAADVPADWRTEAWHGVEIKVPRQWGWGGAPVEGLMDCDSGPARAADGSPVELTDPVPYVGRSVMLSDACSMIRRDRPDPAAPYVWLGAPLPAGEVRMGEYVEETIEVGGTTVTVATDDPGLRAQILATAKVRPADAECASELSAPPTVPLPAEGIGASRSMLVCTYDQDDGQWQLTSTMALGEEAANTFRRGFDRAPAATCQPADAHELAVIRIAGDDNFGSGQLEQLWVVKLGECSNVTLVGKPVAKRLTRGNVEPWAVRSVPVLLTGPTESVPELNGFFIGILG